MVGNTAELFSTHILTWKPGPNPGDNAASRHPSPSCNPRSVVAKWPPQLVAVTHLLVSDH